MGKGALIECCLQITTPDFEILLDTLALFTKSMHKETKAFMWCRHC